MKSSYHQPIRIAVIGAGNVGATFAYALALSGLASEIVLIDSNRKKAEGEAMDLNHAIPMAQPCRIWAGDFDDCRGSIVSVVTAGSAQKPGESRLDLLERNSNIFQSIIPAVLKNNPEGIILVASNPVDILTQVAWKLSGLSHQRVIGSGTILDTARFRYLLSQHFDVDPRSVHAYIIGEHGDSEVPVWSLANIAGMRLREFCAMNGFDCQDEFLTEIFRQTRDAAYHIIERKGATYYAIGAGLVRIVEAIIRDQGTVLSVSCLLKDYYQVNVIYLSMPCVIDRSGVERTIRLDLSDVEIRGLTKSAAIIRSQLEHLGFA